MKADHRHLRARHSQTPPALSRGRIHRVRT
jgi:hypothetical protein